MPQSLQAGSALPDITLPLVGGGEATLGAVDGWKMVIVYRGKHCPLCRKYLAGLEGMLDTFAGLGVEILLVSADPLEKAAATVEDWGLTLPVAYSLSVPQMHSLGLYVSDPRSVEETDRPFAEPGLFVLNAEGKIQIVDLSNAPFARPDLAILAGGIGFAKDKGYPIRGTKLAA